MNRLALRYSSIPGHFATLGIYVARTYRAHTLNLFNDALARHALSIQDVIKVNNRTHVPTLEHYHSNTIRVRLDFAKSSLIVRFLNIS